MFGGGEVPLIVFLGLVKDDYRAKDSKYCGICCTGLDT